MSAYTETSFTFEMATEIEMEDGSIIPVHRVIKVTPDEPDPQDLWQVEEETIATLKPIPERERRALWAETERRVQEELKTF